jgi:hypothetical protein
VVRVSRARADQRRSDVDRSPLKAIHRQLKTIAGHQQVADEPWQIITGRPFSSMRSLCPFWQHQTWYRSNLPQLRQTTGTAGCRANVVILGVIDPRADRLHL